MMFILERNAKGIQSRQLPVSVGFLGAPDPHYSPLQITSCRVKASPFDEPAKRTTESTTRLRMLHSRIMFTEYVKFKAVIANRPSRRADYQARRFVLRVIHTIDRRLDRTVASTERDAE